MLMNVGVRGIARCSVVRPAGMRGVAQNRGLLNAAQWEKARQGMIAASANTNNNSKKAKLDRSLLKTVVWVVIFGSALTHVIDKQKQYEEMTRRYSLKAQILRDILARVKTGEAVNIEEELKLVNLLFIKDKPTVSANDLSQREVSSVSDEPESLEYLWSAIKREMEDDGPVSRAPSSNDDILRDSGMLRKKAQEEKKALEYFPTIDKHIIVEQPGEFVDSAKETQISKFL